MRRHMEDVGMAVVSIASAAGPSPAATILLALSLGSAAAFASVTPPQAPSCAGHLKSTQFSGTFDWRNPRTQKIEKLRFVIGQVGQVGQVGHVGQTDQDPQGPSVAQVWAGDQCRATCSSVDFGHGLATGVQTEGEFSLPISLDLNCHGEEMGPLAKRVAVLWSHGAKPSTLLRFGSWVEGYEQAPLKIEVDQFARNAAIAAPRLAAGR